MGRKSFVYKIFCFNLFQMQLIQVYLAATLPYSVAKQRCRDWNSFHVLTRRTKCMQIYLKALSHMGSCHINSRSPFFPLSYLIQSPSAMLCLNKAHEIQPGCYHKSNPLLQKPTPVLILFVCFLGGLCVHLSTEITLSPLLRTLKREQVAAEFRLPLAMLFILMQAQFRVL